MNTLEAQALYPETAIAFLERLEAACLAADFPFDMAVRRYCAGDRTVQVTQRLRDEHRRLACQRE